MRDRRHLQLVVSSGASSPSQRGPCTAELSPSPSSDRSSPSWLASRRSLDAAAAAPSARTSGAPGTGQRRGQLRPPVVSSIPLWTRRAGSPSPMTELRSSRARRACPLDGARLAWPWIALLAAVAWTPALASSSGAHKKAAAGYERAVRMRAELEARPQRSRSLEDYRKLILAFQTVYQTDVAYQKSPAALADAAQLEEEMGWQFGDKRYYVASIEGYRFLITQYPGSSLARDALFTMGEIYRVDLIQPHDARKIFQRFVAQYPNTAKAQSAREKLKQIEQFEAKANPGSPRVLESDLPPESGVGAPAGKAEARIGTQAGNPLDRPSRPAVRPQGPTDEADPADLADQEEQADQKEQADQTSFTGSGKLPELTGVRFWVGANYTRVVIALDDEVKFNSTRLAHPDRLVFDLAGCRLSPSVAGKTFPVEDRGFLRQVRVAQFRPGVARAVLDVKRISEYSVFSLP